MSAGQINELMEIWAGSFAGSDDAQFQAPFLDAQDLYKTIDAVEVGDVKWQMFHVSYSGDKPADDAPEWMSDKYEVHYRDPRLVVRNMLKNTDFDGVFDYVPFREYGEDRDRRWCDFFSGDWTWEQAVRISE